jgi:NADPH:quinone reductase-like Zn-dependent oxidoreductase
VLGWLPGGKHMRLYSINLMRVHHPAWFREDLERLLNMLAEGAIRPRVAKRISFDEVAEAHRRLEAGGLAGKLVLCPNLGLPRGEEKASTACGASAQISRAL